MFANIGELLASSSMLEPLVADELPAAKWTDGLTVELLVAKLPAEWLVECVRDELPPEWVVAEGRLGMRLSMPRARAVEEYSNSSKVKWGVNCIRKRFYDE